MKLVCDTTRLKDAVVAAERLTGKRTSLPVLKYILVIAGEQGVKLRATNLDIGVEIDIPARVTEEGVTAVPGDVLGNFLSCLSGEKNVTLELVRENILIASEKQSTIIKCAGYEDFPNIPVPEKGITFTIDGKQLIAGFRATAYSAALSDIKPEFASIMLGIDGGHLVFAASDSSRLAEKRIAIKNLPPEQSSILVPVRNAAEIMRLLEQFPGEVTVVVTKHQLGIIGERVRITSRLIDGVFPDYKQIIPKVQTTEAVVLREDLLNALKLTNVFSGKLQQVRLKIYPNDKVFEVESRQSDVGENTTRVDATLTGDDVELLFNQRFIGDVLTYISTDSISLTASVGKPLIIRPIGDQTFTYLVMPMRV